MKDILKSSVLHNKYDLSSRASSTEFYKENFSSKDVPRFSSVTILLINRHKNTHPLKFVNQQCSFYSSYDLCVFCVFKFQYSIHKKACPQQHLHQNSSFLSYYIQGNNCRKSTRKQQVTTGYIINFIDLSCVLCTSVDSLLDPFYSRKLILFILTRSGCTHVTIL